MRLSERINKALYESSVKFKPPKSVQKEAQKALDYREKHGDSVNGGTRIGWTRAGKLARGEEVSLDVVKRMKSFFARHEGNQRIAPENKNEPWKDAGHVAWLLWGGDSAKNWVKGILDDVG